MTDLTCGSCGMPVDDGPYCVHCVTEGGELQSFEQRLAAMAAFANPETRAWKRPRPKRRRAITYAPCPRGGIIPDCMPRSHSALSASMGSTRVARSPGPNDATRATSTKRLATVPSTRGSRPFTRKRSCWT